MHSILLKQSSGLGCKFSSEKFIVNPYPKIIPFEMLQSTYLNYIRGEAKLRESKTKMRKSSYSLIKSVQAN